VGKLMSLRVSPPRELGLDEGRWTRAVELAHEMAARDLVPAVAFQVVRRHQVSEPIAFGRQRSDDAPASPAPLPRDTIFLTASLSKPLVAMGVLRLVEQGRLSLHDRVVDVIPEYDAAPKRPTTIRHLLTHTSGLPDQLPNNRPLRQAQADLSRFVAGACGVTLDFPPGRGVQYQSMGYALLGETVARVSGLPCAEFLRRELFAPLEMHDTSLGVPADGETGPAPRRERIAAVRVPAEQAGGDDWNWNSAYWRRLGAPWGGVYSTVEDLSRFLQMMLRGGECDSGRLFAPETITAATANQLEPLHDLPDADRRTRGWGYGWRLNWTAHSAAFGDLLSPETYGHWGATGTLWWVDPRRDVGLVLLSTQPLERDRTDLLRLSNVIAAAVTGGP
jgi:CubicO group peptidase (beta-lactamase class C family)